MSAETIRDTTAAVHATAYDFHGQAIFVTGGFGVLGGAMVAALAAHGANVAVLSRRSGVEERVAQRFGDFAGTGCIWGVEGDVLDPDSLAAALAATVNRFGAVDGLINAAGGNRPEAITNPNRSFFDLPPEALRWVFDLNLMGTILPSQVVGRHMAERGRGVILNITSMAALTPLTRWSPTLPPRPPSATSRSGWPYTWRRSMPRRSASMPSLPVSSWASRIVTCWWIAQVAPSPHAVVRSWIIRRWDALAIPPT